MKTYAELKKFAENHTTLSDFKSCDPLMFGEAEFQNMLKDFTDARDRLLKKG